MLLMSNAVSVPNGIAPISAKLVHGASDHVPAATKTRTIPVHRKNTGEVHPSRAAVDP
jgi:hypothetical protein